MFETLLCIDLDIAVRWSSLGDSPLWMVLYMSEHLLKNTNAFNIVLNLIVRDEFCDRISNRSTYKYAIRSGLTFLFPFKSSMLPSSRPTNQRTYLKKVEHPLHPIKLMFVHYRIGICFCAIKKMLTVYFKDPDPKIEVTIKNYHVTSSSAFE